MSCTALLVATLVGLVVYWIQAAIARAVAWCRSLAQPSTAVRELDHHGHGGAVIAPPRNCRSARRTTDRWVASVASVALGPPREAELHRLFRPAPWETLAIGGDFDTIRATLGGLRRRYQRAATVFCTRL